MSSMLHISQLPDVAGADLAAVVAASWFGAGFVEPLRAGLAVATVWPLAVLASRHGAAWPLALCLVLSVAGTWAANGWQAAFDIVDDRRIVIDEVAGYLAAVAVARIIAGWAGWRGGAILAAAFLVADRLKPWPFDRVETVPGGAGVMLDDLVVAMALGAAAGLGAGLWRGHARC